MLFVVQIARLPTIRSSPCTKRGVRPRRTHVGVRSVPFGSSWWVEGATHRDRWCDVLVETRPRPRRTHVGVRSVPFGSSWWSRGAAGSGSLMRVLVEMRVRRRRTHVSRFDRRVPVGTKDGRSAESDIRSRLSANRTTICACQENVRGDLLVVIFSLTSLFDHFAPNGRARSSRSLRAIPLPSIDDLLRNRFPTRKRISGHAERKWQRRKSPC